MSDLISRSSLLYPFVFLKNDFINNRKIFIRKLIGLVVIVLLGLVYFYINRYNDMRFSETKPFIWIFGIDHSIPFSKYSIIPYYYWYFYVAGTIAVLFFRKDHRLYFRQIYSMALGVFISAVIYVVFPTYVPRPTLTETDFLTNMVRNIHQMDPPYNCFPSMHVLYTFICFWHLNLLKKNSVWFLLFNLFSLIIISASTVYTKQHYTPDILGGIAVGLVVCLIFGFTANRARR